VRVVKVWISLDMEGVAGIVDWEQCRPGHPAYQLGCELVQAEVNAAIEGAVEAGATEIVVNDSHGRMANLDPRKIAGNARYISGRHKPRYMMEGLDDSFDAIFFVGYHGSISGRPSTLSHTYNPDVFARATLNGREVSESGINALVADHFDVPIALVTGDQVTWAETEPYAMDAIPVITKESITRAAANNLHPAESCRLIKNAAAAAVHLLANAPMARPRIGRPAVLELDLQTADMAEVATWVRSVERSGERQVRIAGEDLLSIFTGFVAVTYITRQAGGR
jgi:D-amino peptidase